MREIRIEAGSYCFTIVTMANKTSEYVIITWNVRGLGSPSKRQKIHAYLHRRGVHIALLQETHLTKDEVTKLQRRWRGRLYATETSAYARGALIWVRTGVPFEASDIRIDKNGRWVMVRGRLNGQEITLGCIYAPNQGQLQFFQEMSSVISEVRTDKMMIGGDFNCVLDVALDRSTHSPPTPSPPASQHLSLAAATPRPQLTTQHNKTVCRDS